MSLFKYAISASGTRKEGQLTAKTEEDARKRVAQQHPGALLLALCEAAPRAKPAAPKLLNAQPTAPKPPNTQPAQPNAPKAKVISKLERMLFLQNGRCFFCGQPLALAEASIEHLNPRSRGGPSTEDNEVVCHKTLNEVFGALDLKRKFEYTLRNAGQFKCP